MPSSDSDQQVLRTRVEDPDATATTAGAVSDETSAVTVRAGTARAALPLPIARNGPPSLAAVDEARFDDEGELARGGMGTIRRVFDRRLQRRQAMKVLDESIEKGSRVMARFVEEARIAGQLDHPNIVPVYDLGLGADGSPAFITMKMVIGETFAAFLEELGEGVLKSPNLERAIRVLIKVCEAVSFAHSRGVIHCDIKPANLMIGSHGQVYVMDWGLAFMKDPPQDDDAALRDRPEPGAVLGTPAYMAPEQARGRVDRIDERTDVYALGGTLYRLLTGKAPHYDATPDLVMRKARTGVIVSPEEAGGDRRMPPELCRIAMKALAADPNERHQSVEQLQEEFEAFLRGGGWLPTKTFADGEIILVEGAPADAAYIIVEGQCEAYKTIGDRRVSLRMMGPGEVFGEAAVFTSQPRTASVVARGAVKVKVVTSESLDLELSRNTWISALVKALADRFRDLDAQLSKLRDHPKE